MPGRVYARRKPHLMVRLRWVQVIALMGAAVTAAAQRAPIQTLTPAQLAGAQRERAAGSVVPLEGVVDSDAYTVGPGDVFSFAIGGRFPVEQRAAVTADGMLIVPEVGSFRVAGRALTSVRSELRAALRRRYANVDSDAALAEPRRFVVHVSGAVLFPGRHAVVPVARLEDALAEAMGEGPMVALRRLHDEEEAVLPGLRNVDVQHADGTAESYDVLRYYSTGDTRFNPYLRDGDVVHVPSFTRSGRVVFVEDRFSAPVPYDYRDGDTAADILEVARGRHAQLEIGGLRVLRVSANGGVSAFDIDGGGVARGEAGGVALQPQDRIRIVEPNAQIARVEAVGAIRFPGNYSIEEGRTTLRQLVDLAGGVGPNALPRGAYLERRGANWPNPEFETGYEPTLADIAIEDRARFIEAQAYDASRLSGLPFESRQFMARELLTFQRLSIDLPAVLAGSADDVVLRDGDRLVVPRDPGGVLVVGQVERPGLVPFRPGADAEDYVTLAGGRGPAATHAYLREAASGAVRPASGADVRSGDVVFVDREPAAISETQQSLLLQRQQFDAQARRDRADSRYRLISTVLGVAGTVVSAVALIVTLDRTN